MWRVAVKHAGRRETATRRTRGEAAQAGAEILLRLGGAPGRATSTTVDEALAAWLAAADLSITYRADVVSVLERVPAEFRARTLHTVTPAVVEGLYRQMAAAGVTAHRIRRVHTVLSSVWTMSIRYEWARANPFVAARKPAAPRRAVRPPTGDEVRRILAAARPELVLYLELAAATGARRGELVGLQWGDVVDGAVVIRRAVSYAAGQSAETEGKSGAKGHRVVAVDAALAQRLKAHRLAQVELALGAGLASPIWVFSHDAGVHHWRLEWITREFADVRAAAGVDGVRMHDLRHYMATNLLGAGIPLKVVSERLGHTKITTTADVYGHYLPAADQLAADVMGALRAAGGPV